MNRFYFLIISTLVLVLTLNVDYSDSARLNKSESGSAIFPDYPPSSLNVDDSDHNNGELRTFQEVELKMKGLIDDVIKKVLPYVIRASADIRLSGRCMASIFKVVLGMQKLQEWAIKMVDATGKPPSGVFRGTSMSLGDFDECVDVSVGKNGKEPEPGEREYFHGKYCTVEVKLPKGILEAVDEYVNASPEQKSNTSLGTSTTFLNMLLKYGSYIKVAAFRFGVCIPSTCDVEDLTSIGSTVSKQLGFPLNVLHCQEKPELELNVEQIIIIVVFVSIIGCICLSTVGEIYYSKYPPIPTSEFKTTLSKVFKSFSAIDSTKKLLKVETDNHPIPVLRGLFTLTVVLNILAHTYLLYNHLFFLKYTSVINFFDYMKDFSFSVIANGSNGIENYFFIAGFLVTFVRWKKSSLEPTVDLPKLLFRPYIRLTLLQLLGIGLFLLTPLVGYGPFWGDFVGPYLQNCREKWWINLFYIQNYWDSDNSCMYHSWILAALMQLYIIAAIVLWILIKKPNLAMFLMICLIVCGMAFVGSVVFRNKLPGALALYLVDGVTGPKMWNVLFIKTFDHVGSFSIGLITGYLVAKHRNSLKFGTVATTVIWCIALASFMAVMFGLYEYRHVEAKMDSSVAIIYAMMNRNVYALFIAWFIIACVTGKAGFLPDMLAWKALIPVYRLSFLAYILHLLIIYYHIGILRERVYLSHEENIINFFGYLMCTYILSYICYIFFQAPYMCIENYFMGKSSCGEISDIENSGRNKDGNSSLNNSITAKSIKRHMQTLSVNGLTEKNVLATITSAQEKF